MTRKLNMLDQYRRETPTNQAILDLFEGEWSSAMPSDSGLTVTPGGAGLFQDSRIAWAAQMIGGFAGKSVLELGPLEGGHSYMAQQYGAERVLAIEANQRAFLKCLCVKEVFGLHRVRFMLGDFVEYLRKSDERFDVVFANGVIYHLKDPVDFFNLVSKTSDVIVAWTQYYDHKIINDNRYLRSYFEKVQTETVDGVEVATVRRNYKEAVEWAGYCGGIEEYARWMTRETLFALLAHHGYDEVHVAGDDPMHQNGPALGFVARRTGGAG